MVKTIALVLVLLLALPSMVFANTVSTDARVAASTSTGAELRLLQLERAITRAILQGERIINYAQEKDIKVDAMVDILAELNVLRHQVVEVDVTSETVVREFVALRQEANALTQRFREESRAIFNQNEVTEIRRRLQVEVETNAQLQDRRDAIRQRTCVYNAQQVSLALENMELENARLVANVESCNVSRDYAMLELRRLYSQLELRRREEVTQRVVESSARIRTREIAEVDASTRVSDELVRERIQRAQEIKERELVRIQTLRENRIQVRDSNDLVVENRVEARTETRTRANNDVQTETRIESNDTSVTIDSRIEVR